MENLSENFISCENLVSWINFNKSIILVYPPTISKYNVIASIITIPGFIGKNILFMTTNYNNINNCLPNKLPSSLYTSYDISTQQLNNFNNLAINGNISYLIIDDIHMWNNSNILNLDSNINYIFIASLGLTENNYNILLSNYPSIKYASYQFSNNNPTIDYKVSITNMNDEQKQLYNNSLTLQSKFKFDTQMNISLCINNIDSLSIDQMYNYSPKLTQLITLLLLKSQERHIIYSKYNDISFEVLEHILKILKKRYLIISSLNSKKLIHEEYGKWKYDIILQSSPSIILTDTIPTFNISKVSNIHFIDDVDYFIYKGFIDKIYNRNMYNTGIGNLTIYFHISNNNDSNIDTYNNIEIRLTHEQSIYNTLLKKSKKIIYDP